MSSYPSTPNLTSPSTESLATESLPPAIDSEEFEDDASGLASPETIKPNPGPAHPTHYLCRGGGKFTPLIALDELPPHLKVVGQSLSISFKDIVDAGGVPCMPAVEKAKDCYLVVLGSGVPESNASEHVVPDTGFLKSESTGAINIPSSGTINARLSRAIDGVGDSTDPEKLKQAILQLKANKASGSTQRYNPTTPGVLGQKVYCTHWMRTGECDFTQQGCMFLHAMPDLDTLELLGFRSYPRWFREMPRDYQVQNAKDFNETGLDQHRHSHRVALGGEPSGGNWYNQGNRYMPPRGLVGPGFSFGPQSPQMMPLTRMPYGAPPGLIQSQPPTPQGSPGPFEGGLYSRPFTPEAFGNNHPPHPFYNGPPAGPSIWSRTTSPAMDVMNRLHKPLSPEVTATYPPPTTPIMSGSPLAFSQTSPPFNPETTVDRSGLPPKINTGDNKKHHNSNPRVSLAHQPTGRGRGRQGRRQVQTRSPKNAAKVADKNPFGPLSVEGSQGDAEAEN